MSLATWWLWRCHALVDGCGTTLQGFAGSCRVYRKSHYHDGVSASSLAAQTYGSPFHRRRELLRPSLTGLGSRRVLLTCPSAASSGGAGTGSTDEDFSDGGDRAFDSLLSRDWFGSFIRKMSGQAKRRRDDDPGDWKYSPEWWGTQGGGWGRNDGDIVFEMPTFLGNGVVSVTAHPASQPTASNEHPFLNQGTSGGSNGTAVFDSSLKILGYEWRVLRFNSITRQSVAKVMAVGTGEDAQKVVFLQQPNCIAFEYVKSLISAGLAAVSFAGLDVELVATGLQKMRILCIGLGGGTLPLFLAHYLPGATVDAVEIDSAVISAAVNTMGFPPCHVLSKHGVAASPSTYSQERSKHAEALWGSLLRRISIYESDGEDFVWEESKKAKGQYDLVFVDAYDGEDVVPFKFWDRNGYFLSSLGSILSSDHGTVVVNLHTDSAPPSMVERLSGKFGPGYDPALPQGKRVQEAAVAYRDVLLRGSDSWRFQNDHGGGETSSTQGLAFTASVSLQGNISLVVSRVAAMVQQKCMELSGDKGIGEELFVEALVKEAKNLQRSLCVPFDMAKRISRGFKCL
ncbi:hypothetical protein MPTK1_5g07620 [Marchantia polymorpha subsp. ruderalis]|nr:hypothetical protein MARPO_0127s0023 [Marchantia polymorpha]BBN10926.1 hypothetical protein Mp_5g07620 [Marchantia polymorpha subsp. ruderalis]|eukprot:PTQ30237.1 hypothetical protein MARPO_0127s0023 [Marchantia polymorpha]